MDLTDGPLSFGATPTDEWGNKIGGSESAPRLIQNQRLNSPEIKKAIQYLSSINIQEPEISEIRRILEWGLDGIAKGLDKAYAIQESAETNVL